MIPKRHLQKKNLKKETYDCGVCKKKFTTYTWDSSLGDSDIRVVEKAFCSNKCKAVVDEVIRASMKWERDHPILDWFSWRWNDFLNITGIKRLMYWKEYREMKNGKRQEKNKGNTKRD